MDDVKPEPPQIPVTSPFAKVKPTPEMVEQMQWAERAYEVLRFDIKNSTKMGRYQSLAITALEESAMWLNKSITHDG